MDKEKLVLEAVQGLVKLAGDLRFLADSIQAVCSPAADSLSGKKPEALPEPEAKPVQEIPLEKVRGILAEKSRDGHTVEVRDIIRKYGADRLSDIDPKDYAAVIAEAEVL